MTFRSFGLALVLATSAPAALLPGHLVPTAQAQQKQAIILEDIWTKPTFRQANVPGFDWLKDGRYYAALGRDGSLQQSCSNTA